MAGAIVVRRYGASDVLGLEDVTVGSPGDGEIRLRQTAIGVNFHDVYCRSGLYDTLRLPGIPGCEAVGVVEQVEPGVDTLSPGDRVAYVTSSYGAYAAERTLPAALAVPVPDTLDDDVVAATFLRGLTVHMLARQVHPLRAGMTVLVHAAAGGVGRLLCQWASKAGVTVIGTVGSPHKAVVAREAGCAETILYRERDVAAEIARITGGRGVDVVFDSVGHDTFPGSLAALALRGHLVNFGQSSGPVEPLAMSTLATKSLTVTRPILFHYLADPAAYRTMAAEVFAWLAEGTLRPEPPQRIPLADASRAHDALESRSTVAPIVLIP